VLLADAPLALVLEVLEFVTFVDELFVELEFIEPELLVLELLVPVDVVALVPVPFEVLLLMLEDLPDPVCVVVVPPVVVVILLVLEPVLEELAEFDELEVVLDVPELLPVVALEEPLVVEAEEPEEFVVAVSVADPVVFKVDAPLFVEDTFPVPVLLVAVSMVILVFEPESVDELPSDIEIVVAPPIEVKPNTLNVLICLVTGWDSVRPCRRIVNYPARR